MLHYFLDLQFLKREVANLPRKNAFCVLRNPSEEPVEPPVAGFRFVGYDLVDLQNDASALTNCGGFPEVFTNSELSPLGLLTEFKRAMEVQTLLRSRFPEEPQMQLAGG